MTRPLRMLDLSLAPRRNVHVKPRFLLDLVQAVLLAGLLFVIAVLMFSM